ncbi:MAG: phosphate signaling complex protein PhoU [Anaerolineae bacterium]|nr:phosphate signaling complex protein PhoU [Anaerolineae bacterium]
MARERYITQLNVLRDRVLKLGNLVEENVVRATESFVRRDLAVSAELIATDQTVNAECISINMAILQLIALQQPIATDMRFLAASLEIVDELERIHDYIKSIGKISTTLESSEIDPLIGSLILQMGEKVRYMLHLSLDAYAKRDADLAYSVPAYDNDVDKLFEDANHRIIALIMADSTQATAANYVQWATHNLERSGDRAINICEWVVYLVTAEYREFDSEYEMPRP